jgi:peptidoglycan hydrolase-like protein with peptidoglycan-binding domain
MNKALTKNRNCVAVAAKNGGGGAGSDDLIIAGAVGERANNPPASVKAVQEALNEIPPDMGGPTTPLATDGLIGKNTINAIRNFQQQHFGFQDGRVDVMGRTHAKLSCCQPKKRARMALARTYLDRAMNAMRGAQTKLTLAGVELISGGGLSGGRNLALADAHFSIQKSPNPAAALAYVASVYTAMLSTFARPGGIAGWKNFEAEPFTNPTYFAFTWWGGNSLMGRYAGWQRLDTIYLSAAYDTASDDDRTQTLIHELAHFVGPVAGDQIFDYAYGRRSAPAMLALTPYQKQHNAESYGNFALSPAFD